MTTTPATPAQVRGARGATFTVFALAGLTFAAWASRIADMKSALQLSPGELGVTLLAMSLGSIVSLPLAGRVVERFGVRRSLRGAMVVAAIGAVVAGCGVDLTPSRAQIAAGLLLLGLGIGTWDVAMNLEATDVERHLGRAIMPHFHAAFSAATVASALIGAGLSWAHVPIYAHLSATAAIVLAIGLWASGRTLPHEATAAAAAMADPTTEPGRPRSPWRERRTLLVGILVFVAAFTEGTANDWIVVAFEGGHHLPGWAGILAFATFLTAMTIGRTLGTRLLDRHGRVPVLQACFALAVGGALLVVFGPAPIAFIGAAIWGIGASLGFPVGMGAAADDPRRAAARMSVIATIGYAAFIAGPPLLGFLGDHVGVLHSLLVVGALAILAIVVVPAAREDRGDPG